jgi:hypothetical protein
MASAATADILERAYISLVLALLYELPQRIKEGVKLICVYSIADRIAVLVCEFHSSHSLLNAY